MRHSVLAALCISALTLTSLHAEALSVRADSWPPYNYEPGAKPAGFVVDLLHQAFGVEGIDYQAAPWNRALEQVQEGKIDAVIGASQVDIDQKGMIRGDEMCGMSGTTIMVLAGSTFKYTDIESLAAIKLGVIDGYNYNEPMDPYIAAHPERLFKATGDDALEKLIKMLLAKRIDAVVDDPAVLAVKLKALGATDQVRSAGAVVKAFPIYVGFSGKKSDSAARAKRLDETIRALRASGELTRILGVYGIVDWAPAANVAPVKP